jgi:two-component system response regulator AlgR
MTLRVLIVDDEALARLRLRSLVESLGEPPGEPAATVVGEADDAESALAWLQREAADVLLLDIRMPGRGGLRLAAALKTLPQPPAVVFVTAHAEHALDAFELEAVDYLTKPVRRERLQAALQRVQQRLQPRSPPVPTTAAVPVPVPVLVVHDRGRVLRLPVAEVLYLRAELKYVTLRTAAHRYVLDEALADLAQRLGSGFIRIHRNALVARSAVRALALRVDGARGDGDDGWAVQVAPTDEWLAVSRRQLPAVREALLAQGGAAPRV